MVRHRLPVGSTTLSGLRGAVLSFACLAAVCPRASRAAERGLARHFPEETLLYVAADDVQRCAAAFRETGLGRVWRDEDTQSFLEPFMKWYEEAVGRVRDETGFDVADLAGSLTRRAAAGLWTDFAAKAAVIAVVEPPDDETGRRLVETLPHVLRRLAPQWRWDDAVLDPAGMNRVGVGRGKLSFAFRDGAVFAALDTDGSVLEDVVWNDGRARLTDSRVFAAAAGKLGEARDLVAFANLEALWKGLELAARDQGDFQKVKLVLDALGLADTKATSFGLAAEPPGFRTRTFVQAPPSRKGLYSLLKDEPLGDGLLGAIPADAAFLYAARLDLSRIPRIVRDAAADLGVPPEAVDLIMAKVAQRIGFDPEGDLLANLGDEAAMVLISPDAVGGLPVFGLNGLCLVAKVKDRSTLGRGLVKVVKTGAKYAEESGYGARFKLKHAERTIRGVELAGMIAPCCTLTDNYLVLGPAPSAVELMIDTIEGGAPSILNNPSFHEAFARLDRGGAVAISYGAKPELRAGGATPMASTGVMAGLLLPALGAARERARRTKCASNLKQIGFALHLFAADNDESFPEDLDELIDGNYVADRDVFVCPAGGGGYVYVSGLDAAGRADFIVAFDREGNHKGEGRNALLVGGNVEWMSEGEFAAALENTVATVRAAGKDVRIVEGPAGEGRLVPDDGRAIAQWIAKTFPFYRLPPMRLVNRNMFPFGGVTRWTEDGLVTEGYGPLPVSVGPSSIGSIAGGAVVAAIAIPNLMASSTSSNETAAVAMLRTYLTAQNQFHRTDFYEHGFLVYANPKDGKGFPDLYQVGGPGSFGPELRLIDEAFARATSPASPRAGYYFLDITRDTQGGEFDFSIDCGLCAVPARYGNSGKMTFVIDVTGVVYQKDTGGREVTQYPDVAGGGWVPVGP